MTRAAWAWTVAAGCLLIAGNGCYHPPYAPNYSYPTYPAAPGAYPAAPGGSYVVPGGTVPGSMGVPSTTYPSGPGPTLAPPINGSNWGGDAPPQTYDPAATPPANGSGAVPGYDDPTMQDFGTDPGRPSDGYLSPSTGGANASPFYQGTAVPQRNNTAQATPPSSAPRPNHYLAGVDDYDATKKIAPASFETTANEDFGAEPTTSNQPEAADDGFGYEHSSYRWLRGVVDFDPEQKNWHIIYGLTPDSSDKFGGSLVLADNGQLADFQDNDVVLVEGKLDPQAGQDVLGKPYYRVTRAELLGRFE